MRNANVVSKARPIPASDFLLLLLVVFVVAY